MNSAVESVKKILLTMLLALGVGAIIILVIVLLLDVEKYADQYNRY